MTQNLNDALRALNEAAYAAIRAGKTTVDLDREALIRIARETDRLVDSKGRIA
jgi:hypothetical protein